MFGKFVHFFLRQYPHNKYKSRELCARATVIYIELLAAKEYKNQQLKQLKSTTCAPINFLGRSREYTQCPKVCKSPL